MARQSQSKTPSMAIITRTKNRPLLLERALKSVLNQTNNDYVHVIINDGGHVRQLTELLDKYPDNHRVVISNKVSVGMIKALNQAIRAVDSEFICILDDDDTWPEDRLQEVMTFMTTNNCAAAVVKMDIVIEEIVEGKIKKLSQSPHPDSGDGEINLYKQCVRNYLSNGVVNYSRKLYESLGGYDEGLRTAEDWDFGIRLMLQEDVELIKSDHPLFYYHQRPNQEGDQGNSVHAQVGEQERTVNILRNKYLRDDLSRGRIGVGYIMNQAVFDLANVVRLEGHVNFVSRHETEQVVDAVKEASSQLLQQLPSQRVLRKLGIIK